MRALATALLVFLGPATLVAEGRSELDILRARCTEQERQIRTLEMEIESLHSQLALERRRSRGVEPSAAPAAPLPPLDPASYTVVTGDTISGIARRYHTSAEGLMKKNGIADPTRLRVGQKLILPVDAKTPKRAIPVAAPTPAPAQVVETPKPKTERKPASASHNYQVQRGDTLYGIARRHKMSIASLKDLNPKIEDKIVVGQTIAVIGTAPSKKVNLISTKTHTIATKSKPAPASKSTAKKATVKKAPAAAPPKKSTPKPTPVAKKEAPKPAAIKEKIEEPKAKAPTPKTISSIIVMDEISFGNFAEKHRTTPEQLNSLNGWDFKSNLVLARGSEIYVPGR